MSCAHIREQAKIVVILGRQILPKEMPGVSPGTCRVVAVGIVAVREGAELSRAEQNRPGPHFPHCKLFPKWALRAPFLLLVLLYLIRFPGRWTIAGGSQPWKRELGAIGGVPTATVHGTVPYRTVPYGQ